MKTLLFSLLLLTLTLCAQSQYKYPDAYDVALFGDMPYGTAREPAFLRLLADVNTQHPLFAVHIGDTKSGSTRCDDSHYSQVLSWFNSLSVPLIYSPGDNEWTDCLRVNNGAYNPVDRLRLLRQTLFPNNLSLGRADLPLIRQSDDPAFSAYRENAMVVLAPVTYVSIHMPGSNNNREYKVVQGSPNSFFDNDVEYTGRNAANIAWLRQAFKTAKENRSLAVMILTQANMFETFMTTGTGSTHSGFSDFVTALRQETKAFAGEVVMVSGDTHYMRIDKPLTETYPGCTSSTGDCTAIATPSESPGDRILNFTRVEVPGDGDVHYIIAHVRVIPGRVFQFEMRTVPAQ